MKSDLAVKVISRILLVNAIFATIIMYIEQKHFKGIDRSEATWKQWLEFYYFGLTTFTTVGYGDIVPATFEARMLTMLYLFVVLFITLVMP